MDFKNTNIRLIQAAETRTGSVLLTNILHGFFTPDEPVCHCSYFDRPSQYEPSIETNIKDHFILKTHFISFDQVTKAFPQYKIYFIVSIRPERNKHKLLKYDDLPHVVFVDYELLNTTVEVAVKNVYQVLKIHIQPSIMRFANVESAIKRVTAMNERYEQIKHLNFADYSDPFFKIHGHHRDRDSVGGRPDQST